MAFSSITSKSPTIPLLVTFFLKCRDPRMQWHFEPCLVALSDSVEYAICNPLLDKAFLNKNELDPEILVAMERVP
jgi:hypothetical protein